MAEDVRWRQRFQNFERALTLLESALKDGPEKLSDLEREGAAQRFEYTFELAWKCMKDWMESQGLVVSPVTPRQVIKQAFAAKIIKEGQVWIEMLDNRNLLAHTYAPVTFERAMKAVSSQYLPLLKELRNLPNERRTL